MSINKNTSLSAVTTVYCSFPPSYDYILPDWIVDLVICVRDTLTRASTIFVALCLRKDSKRHDLRISLVIAENTYDVG